jgi:hypothetical protein
MRYNMHWLLEHEVFQEDENPLIAALKKLGVEHTLVKFGTPYQTYIQQMEDKRAVFHGSLQFGKQIRASWTPRQNTRVYCSLEKYECTYYYPRLGEFLLNSEYVMLPFGELMRRQFWLFNTLGGDALFVRPSSGYKTFTGFALNKSDWELELRFLKGMVNPEDIVVVAPTRNVKKEWRVVIVGDKPVTAGQYREEGIDVRESRVSKEVFDFAQMVLDFTQYRPDMAWTLDVGETDDGALKIIEPNSFSCAGLYACDYEAVIEAINKLP